MGTQEGASKDGGGVFSVGVKKIDVVGVTIDPVDTRPVRGSRQYVKFCFEPVGGTNSKSTVPQRWGGVDGGVNTIRQHASFVVIQTC